MRSRWDIDPQSYRLYRVVNDTPPAPENPPKLLFTICQSCLALLLEYVRWSVGRSARPGPHALRTLDDLFARLCVHRAAVAAGRCVDPANADLPQVGGGDAWCSALFTVSGVRTRSRLIWVGQWHYIWPHAAIPSLPRYILNKLHKVPPTASVSTLEAREPSDHSGVQTDASSSAAAAAAAACGTLTTAEDRSRAPSPIRHRAGGEEADAAGHGSPRQSVASQCVNPPNLEGFDLCR